MPYLLHLRGDDETPGYSVVADDYVPAAGEVVVDERPEDDEVWDAATGSLRPRTDAETLDEAKARKKKELEAAFAAECARDFASPWVAVGVIAASSNDPRIEALDMRTDKLESKVNEVEAASTEAEVEAVAWT